MPAPSPTGPPEPRETQPVELLERALGYTGPVLAGVRDDLLGAPTPCAGWRLRDLLSHMDDALDAFTEAAAGEVRVGPGAAVADRSPDRAAAVVARLRAKACALLGVWAAAPVAGGDVRLDDRDLGADLLVRVAALEVAVHGWDVARTVGGPALPASLAVALLPTARLLVPVTGRAGRFAPPLGADADAAHAGEPEQALLRWLGRDPAVAALSDRRARGAS